MNNQLLSCTMELVEYDKWKKYRITIIFYTELLLLVRSKFPTETSMKRIAIFQLGYETNSFISGRAQLSDLGSDGWISGSIITELFSGKRAGLSGILAAISDSGAVPVPLDSISRGGAFNAGPIMSRECVEEAMDHICAELAARAGEYDGVCAAMHGAGCAEGYDNADIYFLRRIREVVGNKPIMASLDLHGNITDEMLALTNGLFGIKTNPHLDFYDAGYLAASTLVDMLEGKIKPQMALKRIPLLVPTVGGSTLDGAGKEAMEYVADYVQQHGLIDATFFHAFAATDTVHTSASVLVVADGYVPEQEAQELAWYIWNMRERFVKPSYSASEAIDAALAAVTDSYVVINEGTDNPGAGCPGDGTHLLAEMIRRDLPRSIMGPIFDPDAAAVCHLHQVGDRFYLEVGGHAQAIYGDPLQLEVELLALSDGDFTCVSLVHQGALMHYGPSARLRCGNVELIVVSNRFQTYDDRPYLMTGAFMKDYSIVGLKSSNHFRAYFKDVADAIIGADTPSMFPGDLRKLNFQKILRPIYPLDDGVEYAGEWP